MEWWGILLIVVGVLLIAGFFAYNFGIGALMANKMCRPKHYTSKEEKTEYLGELGSVDGIDQYQRIPITFRMKDGYIIHGDYSLNNKKKFVICMHGHTSIKDGSVKYAYALYRLGYSLIFYDHRSHGENERDYVTMGYRESEDALQIIEQVKERFGPDIEIGLFGVSMGGQTALLCVDRNQSLSFVISDCAFASIKDLVKGFIKQHHSTWLSWSLLPCTNMVLKMKYHFSFKDASAKTRLKNNKDVPILFIHGTNDNFVYPENAKRLYNSCNGPKRLELFEGAGHCESIVIDKERYYKVIEEFINERKGIK